MNKFLDKKIRQQRAKSSGYSTEAKWILMAFLSIAAILGLLGWAESSFRILPDGRYNFILWLMIGMGVSALTIRFSPLWDEVQKIDADCCDAWGEEYDTEKKVLKLKESVWSNRLTFVFRTLSSYATLVSIIIGLMAIAGANDFYILGKVIFQYTTFHLVAAWVIYSNSDVPLKMRRVKQLERYYQPIG